MFIVIKGLNCVGQQKDSGSAIYIAGESCRPSSRTPHRTRSSRRTRNGWKARSQGTHHPPAAPWRGQPCRSLSAAWSCSRSSCSPYYSGRSYSCRNKRICITLIDNNITNSVGEIYLITKWINSKYFSKYPLKDRMPIYMNRNRRLSINKKRKNLS